MFNMFLADATDPNQIMVYVVMGLFLVGAIVLFVFSSKRRKKQEEDAKNLIDAVKPGNKVKTIGGICGIVVEVNAEENTFVLETGSEQSGKCFIKFDRQAIYQTDAVIEKAAPASDDAGVAPAAGEAVPLVPTNGEGVAPVVEEPAINEALSEETSAKKSKKK